MSDAIIQFNTPSKLKDKLKYLQLNLDVLTNYLEKSKLAIHFLILKKTLSFLVFRTADIYLKS